MLAKYLKLLDTFREEKFSFIVSDIKHRILTTVNSDKFTIRLRSYLTSMHTQGVPFTNFSEEPAQVSQIKKVINALYYAEMALKDMERVNLHYGNRRTADLALLYSHTMDHVYKASYTITHLDVDFAEVFSHEIATLRPLFNLFYCYMGKHKEDTQLLLQQRHHLPYKAGLISGIVVDQLHPSSGRADYEFLTQFTAVIPSYLNQLSGYIHQFSARVSAEAPHLDRKKLNDLQYHALLLLTSLNTLARDNFFFSFKLLNYIRIIQHTIKLSMSIIDQIGHVSDSTQDVILEKLTELKYHQLPRLVGFADKIEEEFMLKPGTLSGPLMSQLNVFYESVINFTQKGVNFSKKGKNLLTLEDWKFVALRIEQGYQRRAAHSEKLLRLQETRNAAEIFFKVLKNPRFKKNRILNLSTFTKETLAAHYKWLQPYISKIDSLTNSAIIDGLTRSEGWSDSLSIWARDSINSLLALEASLNALFNKELTSYHFHSELTIDIIDSVHERRCDIAVLPHKPEKSVYLLDEATVLGVGPLVYECYLNGDRLLANPKNLTSADAFIMEQHSRLLQYHEMSRMKLTAALKAYDDFYSVLNWPNANHLLKDYDEVTRKRLLKLYGIFQPYLVRILSYADLRKVDRAIITALASKKATISVNSFKAFDVGIRAQFDLALTNIQNRQDILVSRLKKNIQKVHEHCPLVSDEVTSSRLHYVVKHTKFSEATAYLRRYFYQLTDELNNTIKVQLCPAEEGLPYPEIEEIGEGFEPSNQVLMLKKFFNFLYHLEQMTLELENLQDQSIQSLYVYTILQASVHVREAYYLVIAMSKDDYLSWLAHDLMAHLQAVHATLSSITPYYKTNAPAIAPPTNIGIVDALNVLMILPEQIKSLKGAKMPSLREIRKIHQHTNTVAANIQRVIASSSSYFKLFFEIPTMYRMYRELKEKLKLLFITSHDAVIENLEAIKNEINKILLETDRWEDKLGFYPGLLSGPMNKILDEFYKGLLVPLSLNSPQHLALADSDVQIEQRIRAVYQRIEQATNEQNSLKETQARLKTFCVHINDYKRISPQSSVLFHMRQVLKKDFQEAWPTLQKEKGSFNSNNLSQHSDNQILDDLLNGAAVGHVRINGIEKLVRACLRKYESLSTNQQLIIDTAREKTTYLQQLKSAQPYLNRRFIDDYAKNHFKRQVGVILASQFGLMHCCAEYRQKLASFLEESQPQLIAEAKKIPDIKKKISDLLLVSTTQFQQTYLEGYYQLEGIKVSIEQLKQYIHKSNIAIQQNYSLFENQKTLRKKTQLIILLENVVNNPILSTHSRIENIKTIVANPSFTTSLMTYHCYDHYCFGWLKQSMLSLLELLGLYTPEAKKAFQQLEISLKKPGQMSSLSARFGIFYKPGDEGKMHADENNAHLLLNAGVY